MKSYSQNWRARRVKRNGVSKFRSSNNSPPQCTGLISVSAPSSVSCRTFPDAVCASPCVGYNNKSGTVSAGVSRCERPITAADYTLPTMTQPGGCDVCLGRAEIDSLASLPFFFFFFLFFEVAPCRLLLLHVRIYTPPLHKNSDDRGACLVQKLKLSP